MWSFVLFFLISFLVSRSNPVSYVVSLVCFITECMLLIFNPLHRRWHGMTVRLIFGLLYEFLYMQWIRITAGSLGRRFWWWHIRKAAPRNALIIISQWQNSYSLKKHKSGSLMFVLTSRLDDFRNSLSVPRFLCRECQISADNVFAIRTMSCGLTISHLPTSLLD